MSHISASFQQQLMQLVKKLKWKVDFLVAVLDDGCDLDACLKDSV